MWVLRIELDSLLALKTTEPPLAHKMLIPYAAPAH